jgi:hypothetical protein
MFFIYYGYVSPDHYDASECPTYQIKECSTTEEVVDFRKEFDEDYLHDECKNIIFRVFEGKERFLQPKKVVETYELG